MDTKIKETEKICLMLVGLAGGARNAAIQAIEKAKEKKYELAETLLNEADDYLKEAGREHFKALKLDISNNLNINLLLIHAEDQYINIESVVLISRKIVEMYKEFKK